MTQFIYRLHIAAANLPLPHSAGFRLFVTPWALFGYLRPLIRGLGLKEVAKTGLKLLTPSRCFFIVLCDGAVAHHGWVTLGRCRYYPVEPEAVVIGPVETRPAFRGRGLATVGLNSVVQAMAERGQRIIYIDTSDVNIPMQRVIEKCGFGKPISSYPRPATEKKDLTTNLH